MSDDRKYHDDEVREILDLAVGSEEARAFPRPESEGLTLAELQDIAGEVGVPPDRVTEAAAVIAARESTIAHGTTVGLPTSVGSVVPLPRSLTDREWELLVADLRTTFGGKGELTAQGSLREWSYGTVHAFLEPTEIGYQLRLTDSRETALGGMMAMGGFFLVLALLIFIVLLGKDDAGYKFAVPAFLAAAGLGSIGAGVFGLPGWSRVQTERMEHIAARAATLVAQPDTR